MSNPSSASQLVQLFHTLSSNPLSHKQIPSELFSAFIHSLLQLVYTQPTPDLRHRLLLVIETLADDGVPLRSSSWPVFMLLYAELNQCIVRRVIDFSAQHVSNVNWDVELNGWVTDLVHSLTEPSTTQEGSVLLRLISQSSQIISTSIARNCDEHLISLIKIYESLPITNSSCDRPRYNILLTVYNLLKAEFLVPFSDAAPPRILVDRLVSILSTCSTGYDGFLADLFDHIPSLLQLLLTLDVQNEKLKVLLNAFDHVDQSIPDFNRLTLGDQKSSCEAQKLAEVLKSRKNIFDNHQFEASLLKKGKNRLDERSIMEDKSYLTEDVRAKIKARAEALSSDEEDTGSEGSKPLVIVADEDEEQPDIFSSDDEAFFGATLRPESEEEEGEDPRPVNQPVKAENVLSNRANLAILYRTYVESPDVFDKSSRGSARRMALMNKLEGGSLADDLLESWRLMFERNSDKEKILSKYRSLSAHLPSHHEGEPSDHRFSGPSSTALRTRGAPSGRGGKGGTGEGRGGRGGGGEGRGQARGGRGGGGEGRGQAQGGRGAGAVGGRGGRGQKHNSNKFAHDRRVRGRDKKLNQMSGPSS